MSPGVDFAALRRREFSRLDVTGNAYLDYTGTALYPESLVRRDGQRLLRGVYGNPHSESAARSSPRVDRRERVTSENTEAASRSTSDSRSVSRRAIARMHRASPGLNSAKIREACSRNSGEPTKAR